MVGKISFISKVSRDLGATDIVGLGCANHPPPRTPLVKQTLRKARQAQIIHVESIIGNDGAEARHPSGRSHDQTINNAPTHAGESTHPAE